MGKGRYTWKECVSRGVVVCVNLKRSQIGEDRRLMCIVHLQARAEETAVPLEPLRGTIF